MIELTNGQRMARIPEPRVSNLIIESHVSRSLDELRHDIVEYCHEINAPYYLEVSSKNGQVDIETGTFTMYLDNIHVVFPDGTKQNVLSGSLSGDLFSFVGAIAGISDSYGEDIGMCGSMSGFVPTHGIAPYMFFYGINFTPNKLPEPVEDFDLKRDKYIPPSVPKSKTK